MFEEVKESRPFGWLLNATYHFLGFVVFIVVILLTDCIMGFMTINAPFGRILLVHFFQASWPSKNPSS